MSKSYKQAYHTDQWKSKNFYKKQASKIIRRLLKDFEITKISHKKYYESYKICDYKHRFNKTDPLYQYFSRK